jgi:hypothetical protein
MDQKGALSEAQPSFAPFPFFALIERGFSGGWVAFFGLPFLAKQKKVASRRCSTGFDWHANRVRNGVRMQADIPSLQGYRVYHRPTELKKTQTVFPMPSSKILF